MSARTEVTSRSSLWRDRDFLLLWGGQSVSEIGSQVTVLALPLVAVVVLNAGTLQVGLVSTAATSAYLLVALPAGVLVDRDRGSRRRLMIYCDVARVVLIGSLPVAAVAGVLTLGQLYICALLSSVFSVLFSVSYQSYLPTLLDGDQLMDGNGKLGTSQSVAQIAGPSLGAGLVALVGAAKAMTGDAVSYALSALSLAAIGSREAREPDGGDAGQNHDEPASAQESGRAEVRAEVRPEVRTKVRTPMRTQIGEGLRYVMGDPILRKAVAWSGCANFFVIMVESLGPVFLVRTVHLRPGYVGLLLALGAVGGVAGGLSSGLLARRVGSARISWLSMTVFALPGLLIPLTGRGLSVLLFAVGWMSWTFASTVCVIALTSYRQATCPPEMLGRVTASARWIVWGTLPLGGLVGGVLGSALGVRVTLWIAVVGGCASGLWLFFSPLRGMRDIPVG